MLRSMQEIFGYQIHALDGEIGKVEDFFFDDHQWILRYLVVDTGNWLPDKLVLVYAFALDRPDWVKHIFPVNMTKEAIQNSPPIDADKPVSRQKEIELFQYYAWDPYWMYPDPLGVPDFLPRETKEEEEPASIEEGNPNLRSYNEIRGYHIQSIDSQIGHLEDLILDDDDWRLRYVVVDTRNWLPGGKKVVLATDWITKIDWAENKIFIDLPSEAIENGPEYDPSQPINRQYEARLYDFYGRPVYWEKDYSKT